ncbi:MAG: hypothetical protein GY804_08820 [Alphaproteobacteria bacterium]|nr:hypothetical protein [Alphaproteobacteria bacterium]
MAIKRFYRKSFMEVPYIENNSGKEVNLKKNTRISLFYTDIEYKESEGICQADYDKGTWVSLSPSMIVNTPLYHAVWKEHCTALYDEPITHFESASDVDRVEISSIDNYSSTCFGITLTDSIKEGYSPTGEVFSFEVGLVQDDKYGAYHLTKQPIQKFKDLTLTPEDVAFKLKELIDRYEYIYHDRKDLLDKKICGFIHSNTFYKLTYFGPESSRICGKHIDNNGILLGKDDDNDSIIFDLFESYLDLCKVDIVYFKKGRLFYNGKIITTIIETPTIEDTISTLGRGHGATKILKSLCPGVKGVVTPSFEVNVS